ncbi:hypothetical protein C8R43DRAFT_133480 [Mycena crocata]|nr:hypothetical protein C8R43DRAFT_133480 [Mycena crocata]
MEDVPNNDTLAAASDVLPISPVSDTIEDESVPSTAPQITATNPLPERKLTIRVPVEYIPPTPPPSAELPAIPLPGRRQSLTPVSAAQKKRASAPASSWSSVQALVTNDTPPSAEPSVAPVMPTVFEVVTPPLTVNIPDGEAPAPKMILVSPSHSAIHLPSAAKKSQVAAQAQLVAQAQNSAQEKPVKHRSELLPPPVQQSTRPRRKSSPGQKSLHPPHRIRKSPSINNSPSHVSLIDFESSSDEDEDEDEEESSTPSNTPSIPEDSPTPTPQKPQIASESDLSQWAPEPAYFPNQTISVSHAVNAPPPTRTQWSTRSQSSISQSVRSGERASSTAGSSRRGATMKHHTLLGLSSMPTEMVGLVQRDVDFTMRALMSPEMFANMLNDPLARQRFREFLAVDGTTAELDFWTDAQFLTQSMDQLRANGAAFRDLYVSGSGAAHVDLSPENRRELLMVLQRILAVDSSLGNTQHQLLESLYNDQFQRFVKHKIIQEAHVTLGKANLASQESEGLGDTFVLTNPRLPDHPIVLVSDGFVEVTGYPKAQIIGRNCRTSPPSLFLSAATIYMCRRYIPGRLTRCLFIAGFLQGPGTPPESVQRIRDGLNSGKGCTELLLNYRRNGDPFYCLLCIIPVRDASGAIVYFIGGQTNVTGLLATDKGLGIHGASAGAGDSIPAPQPIQMSSALAAFREQTCGVIRPAASDAASRSRGAAGSVSSNGNGRATGGSGFFRGLFGRSGSTSGVAARPDGKQVIAGAEATINGPGGRGLQDQYAIFQNTYNKIMIFKFKKREITFVSPQMLAYLGLPTRTQRELYSSPLIRSDVASLLTAGEDRTETRRLRDDFKDAIRRGVPSSLYCAIKVPTKGLLLRSDSSRHRFGMMHMTPIKDGDNVAVAFVAIFG